MSFEVRELRSLIVRRRLNLSKSIRSARRLSQTQVCRVQLHARKCCSSPLWVMLDRRSEEGLPRRDTLHHTHMQRRVGAVETWPIEMHSLSKRSRIAGLPHSCRNACRQAQLFMGKSEFECLQLCLDCQPNSARVIPSQTVSEHKS